MSKHRADNGAKSRHVISRLGEICGSHASDSQGVICMAVLRACVFYACTTSSVTLHTTTRIATSDITI